MGNLFYLAGLGLAAFAGYSGLKWFFILISSILLAAGWVLIRTPQIYTIYSEEGILSIPKLFITQTILMMIIAAPVFFIAFFIGRILTH